MALKYAMEALLLRSRTGAWLTPLQFFDPLIAHRLQIYGDQLAVVVLIWTLPFIFMGLSMSMRRALDAGLSSWLGILFVVPYVNWLAMLILSIVPTSPVKPEAGKRISSEHRRASIIVSAFAASLGIAGVSFLFSVYILRSYGVALFVMTPVLMGATTSAITRRHGEIAKSAAYGLGQTVLVVALLALIALAFEGLMCVLMAWPLAAALVFIGSALGWYFSGGGSARGAGWIVAFLALPGIAWHDALRHEPALREVVTAIEIDAPPAAVWRNVVSFPDLPAPDGIFALGIACPLRARIDGAGVGAIRHCEFTTGSFVEPITRWEPEARLSFDVVAQPPAMREISPWGHIDAPHLDGYLKSRRGEFRLVGLPGGRTRLEGSTWYQVDVHPEAYWGMLADYFIHGIHRRVFEHIKRLSEQ